MLLPLTFFTLTGCAAIVWVVRKAPRKLSFQVLVVVNFVVINLLSGVMHILDLGSRRGYYDAVRALDPQQFGHLILIQGVGLLGLCVGLLVTRESEAVVRPTSQRLSHFDRLLLAFTTVIIFPIALIGVMRIREYASTLEVFGGRIISVDGGMARYAFLSQWLVWCVIFSLIWLAYGSAQRSARFAFVTTTVGVVIIAASLSWTGGRSIALVFTLPLIVVMWPLFRKSSAILFTSIVIAPVAILLYLSRLSGQRAATARLGAGNVADWIDWEWGRFSMLGFGVDYVDKYGYLFGETILTSAARVVGFVFADSGGSRSSAQIAGAEILNSDTARYLAPGFSFEMYVNFGMLGVFAGYFAVAWVCKNIDQRIAAGDSVISQLFWAYLGTLVVFRVLPGEPSALLQFLFYSGAPLIVVVTLSYLARRSRNSSEIPASAFQCEGSRPR